MKNKTVKVVRVMALILVTKLDFQSKKVKCKVLQISEKEAKSVD